MLLTAQNADPVGEVFPQGIIKQKMKPSLKALAEREKTGEKCILHGAPNLNAGVPCT